jgi:hypothetical protein
MKTNGVPKEIQSAIRAHFAEADWLTIARTLGITLKSVCYQLDPKSPRGVTFNFIGLLAVYAPYSLSAIQREVKEDNHG